MTACDFRPASNTALKTIISKAKENKEALTRQEMKVYDGFLSIWMDAYHAAYLVDKSGRAHFDVLDYLEHEAPYRFDNPVAREWYKANRYYLHEDLVEVIDRALNDAPMGTELRELDRVRLKGTPDR